MWHLSDPGSFPIRARERGGPGASSAFVCGHGAGALGLARQFPVADFSYYGDLFLRNSLEVTQYFGVLRI